jgi:predicted RNA polymerase sigma factor
LRRLDRRADALDAYGEALALEPAAAQRAHITRRMSELAGTEEAGP